MLTLRHPDLTVAALEQELCIITMEDRWQRESGGWGLRILDMHYVYNSIRVFAEAEALQANLSTLTFGNLLSHL